jgi:hypothetical protein
VICFDFFPVFLGLLLLLFGKLRVGQRGRERQRERWQGRSGGE